MLKDQVWISRFWYMRFTSSLWMQHQKCKIRALVSPLNASGRRWAEGVARWQEDDFKVVVSPEDSSVHHLLPPVLENTDTHTCVCCYDCAVGGGFCWWVHGPAHFTSVCGFDQRTLVSLSLNTSPSTFCFGNLNITVIRLICRQMERKRQVNLRKVSPDSGWFVWCCGATVTSCSALLH